MSKVENLSWRIDEPDSTEGVNKNVIYHALLIEKPLNILHKYLTSSFCLFCQMR